jgi:hypothetical protein
MDNPCVKCKMHDKCITILKGNIMNFPYIYFACELGLPKYVGYILNNHSLVKEKLPDVFKTLGIEDYESDISL